MRRNATSSSKGSGAGRGSRLRLTILVATAAAFLLVPVAQAAAAGKLHVKIAGTGTGKVTSKYPEFFPGTPAIECSGPPTSGVCENTMSELEEAGVVALGATASPGSEFVGWTIEEGLSFSGCEEPEAAECLIAVAEAESEDAKVTATFNLENEKGFLLTVAKTGEGTVVSSPGGIECGSKCKKSFEGTVTLTASPANGYAFNSWAGCTTHVGLTCTVEMSKAKTVKASFIATPSLSVEKAGTGQGKVTATGISCDENCSSAASAVKAGATVTFKVGSAKGSEAAVFEGGSGSASGCSGATCTFTISENSSVKVKFNPKPTNTLTVILTGPARYKGKVTGKGTVKGLTASAIACGSGCTTQTESFFASDTVTLTAVAGTGYKFIGWSGPGEEVGTCTGTTSPCTISTSLNKTLSAEFK